MRSGVSARALAVHGEQELLPPSPSTEKWRKPCSDPSRNVSRANASIRLLRDMVPAARGGGGGGGGGGDGGGRRCCGAGVRGQEDVRRTLAFIVARSNLQR